MSTYNIVIASVYIFCAVLVTVLEYMKPAYKFPLKEAWKVELLTAAITGIAFFPIADYFSKMNPIAIPQMEEILLIPWYIRLVMYYLLADFLAYWAHRLIHTRHLWRAHSWHHSPKNMFWLAGVRGTIPQIILFSAPYVFAAPLIWMTPWWTPYLLTIEFIFRNAFMHMNFTWNSRRLEWVLVTPRFHHVHHTNQPELHDGNYGSLLTIWDRMFGTYVDPEKVKDLKFGVRKPVHPIREAIGF